MKTPEQREKKRRSWLEHVSEAIERRHGRKVVGDELERLVLPVEIWDGLNQCFEFAHFTDRELAEALQAIDSERKAPPQSQLEAILANVRHKQREQGAVIGSVWKSWKPKLSKTKLAKELWPVLEERIKEAIKDQDFERVPIVRVLRRAAELAREVRRENVGIRLHAKRDEGGGLD